MKRHVLILVGGLLPYGMAVAQDDIPLLRPEEREAVEAQAEEFNASLKPALAEAAKSTVRVWSGKRRLAYGTVIGDGRRILTKWSELARAVAPLRVEAAGGLVLAAKITGVYPDEDLAVLETSGASLRPVKWHSEVPGIGGFLAAPQPDGRPAAFGVVSVLERNLKDTDRAYLGVGGEPGFEGPGVRIKEVMADSGAAAAGLRPGDTILRVGERTISGVLELQNSLVGLQPGSKITVQVRTADGGEKETEVVLGNRPALPNFPGDRLRQMERMGGPISQVRDSFTRVVESDMRPKPNQIGGPVVDLQGRVVGVTVARAGRTRAFVMPAAAVEELLKKDGQDPALAEVRRGDDEAGVAMGRRAAQGAVRPPSEARLRQHLSEMQRLMDFMRDEMEGMGVEPGGR